MLLPPPLALALLAYLLGALSFSEAATTVGVVLILVALVPAAWSRRQKATIATLDEQNRSQGNLIRTRDREIEDLTKQLAGAARRADEAGEEVRECEKRIAHLEGELKTMERYTAQGALETVAERIGMLSSGIASLGELVTANMAVLSKLDGHLSERGGEGRQ